MEAVGYPEEPYVFNPHGWPEEKKRRDALRVVEEHRAMEARREEEQRREFEEREAREAAEARRAEEQRREVENLLAEEERCAMEERLAEKQRCEEEARLAHLSAEELRVVAANAATASGKKDAELKALKADMAALQKRADSAEQQAGEPADPTAKDLAAATDAAKTASCVHFQLREEIKELTGFLATEWAAKKYERARTAEVASLVTDLKADSLNKDREITKLKTALAASEESTLEALRDISAKTMEVGISNKNLYAAEHAGNQAEAARKEEVASLLAEHAAAAAHMEWAKGLEIAGLKAEMAALLQQAGEEAARAVAERGRDAAATEAAEDEVKVLRAAKEKAIKEGEAASGKKEKVIQKLQARVAALVSQVASLVEDKVALQNKADLAAQDLTTAKDAAEKIAAQGWWKKGWKEGGGG
ncbi:hypothetical protein T484DRAFT_1880839, partial [Baffinella frigidus]